MNKHQFKGSTNDKQSDRISAARLLIIILKIMGLWHWLEGGHNGNKDFRRDQILEFIQRICLQIPFSFIHVFLMWVEVFTSPNLDEAGDILYMSFTCLALLVKILNIWHYSDKAWNFVNELTFSKTYELLNREESDLWQRKQTQFRNIVIIYLSGGFITLLTVVLVVLFLTEYQLPVAVWLPFEWRTNRRNYWIAYLYNMLGTVVTAVCNVTLDMMGCYMIFHVSLLYKILGLRLNRLKATGSDNVIAELRKIFQLHRNIKRVTKDCERLVSSYVLSQILLSAFILCFSDYRIQKMNISQNLGKFFAMQQFLCCMLLQIYLPCYFGNEIILNSEELCTQIYSSDWLKFSIPIRKLMNVYMEFTKHPAKLTAGNYFVVGLPVFTKVINNAYTFFALLMNVEK